MKLVAGRSNGRQRGLALALTLAVALAAVALASLGSAPGASGRPLGALVVGVATEEMKGTSDNGAGFYGLMRSANLSMSRIVVTWDPSNPMDIREHAAIAGAADQAIARGITVLFVVTGVNPRVFGPAENRMMFPAYLQHLARQFPQVKNYVVGNEPNVTYFWRPQFDEAGQPVSPAAFVDLLARSYDALKAIDPSIRVSGGGLDARGNDDPNAVSNISISPTRFIHYMGVAYRQSGRTTPIMDELSFHPYPASAKDAVGRSYAWPNAGIADLDRLKQALWDAFRGTGQPTVEEGLRFNLNETGWQVEISSANTPAYYGREVSDVTDEATQAGNYAEMIRYLACDPSVRSVLIYRFMDDANLAQWQSGMIRADGSRRQSFDTVRDTVAQTGGMCAGQERAFRHETGVVGAAATFRLGRKPVRGTSFNFSVTAEESATSESKIMRVPTKAGLSRSQRANVGAYFGQTSVAGATGSVQARWVPLVQFPAKRQKAGWYVYAVRLSAELNPERTTTFVSGAFRIG